MNPVDRKYELILFGATGYTGKLCAEHITTHLPTDLKWAIAGRTASKLSAVLGEIKHKSTDRLLPGIEIAALTSEDLTALARKTRLLINTVGPYYLYGTPIVEACATNGTHYLDVTGESAWVLEMIEKYHDIAKSNGAIMIPEIGIESAPSDLLAWSLVSFIRDNLSVGTREIIASVHDMNGAPSGGTLATILGILDHYSLKDFTKANKPWALSPIPGPKPPQPISFASRLLGVRSIPDLGTLATSPMAAANVSVVQRSWGMIDRGEYYGPNFQFNEYMRVRNAFIGVAVHFAFTVGFLVLALPPVRWLARKFVPAPGQGPPREDANRDNIEYRAIATADQPGSNPKRASAMLKYDGGNYYLAGMCLAEAAIVLLRDGETAKRLGGGMLTPAMLGQPFIDRLRMAGLKLETQIMSF